MAFSTGTNVGQAPVCCHLCNTGTNTNWKCLDCDFFMCTKCKDNIHVKFKFAKNHKIVDIRQAGALLREEYIPSTFVNCQQHEQTGCMYCISCDQLVCPTCISETHNGHGLVEIQKGCEIIVEKIKKGIKLFETKINKLTKDEKKIQEIKKAENRKYLDAKESIKFQNETLKFKIDQYTDKLIKEIDQMWNKIQNDTDRETRRILDMKEKLENQLSKSENIIKSKDSSEIFQEVPTLIKSMGEDIHGHDGDPEKFDSIPKFIPGQITENNVGFLQEIGTDITMNKIKQYTTDISEVYYLSTNNGSSLWIANKDTIQKVKPEGDDLKVVRSIADVINDMATTTSNDLLLATGGSTLKKINSKTGELTESKYSVDPLLTTAVCVTRDGEVIVGAWEGGEPYQGKTAVITIDDDGRHQRRYETDDRNQQIFTCVVSITSTRTGILFVVDEFSSDGKGRIVVMSQTGDILNSYTGHPDLNTDENPFIPVSVVSTTADNIIIPDMTLHTLHILNCVGDLINCYDTKNIGIRYPFSVGQTMAGIWYIGCTTTEGSDDKAKLYEVAINGV